ncbi:putative stress-induced transcription regulator [Streptomyces sp. PanSC19]|uniref:CGNR zinc finger domain-containing protein n=1 Tax=Streptomyces sp. PanSC19 TaxID=1520455 RepID=UPI000F4832AE|nr:CGNR zinc finger domain-containing protein [Streptomyces sp. PanSC19]ROQ32958.1 putative stress-induced transcription regulator [Streptomyces sp. PanSC19]
MTGTTRPHSFHPRDLVGGHPVIDLLNTVTARNAADPVDWLDAYPRLLEWAALTGHFTPADLTALRRLAASETASASAPETETETESETESASETEGGPARAARALARVRELREALHDLIAALAHGAPAPADAVARVEDHWKDAVAHARLVVDGTTPRLRTTVEASGLDLLRHELALQALDLLRALPADRTRVCPGRRCGWLFLDTSRAGRRRWCSMATCGNAAKGRTHYERRRAGEGHGAP